MQVHDSHGETAVATGGVVVVAVVAVAGATSTDATGPILAFVGAVLVALVAAYTAGRRQARALAAERERLRLQLEHERELADLADVRALFDTAATILADASRALSAVESGLFTHGAWIGERAPDAWTTARRSAETIRATRERLSVRLTREHAAVIAYNRADEAAWNAVNAVVAMGPPPGGNAGDGFQEVQASHRQLLAAKDEFMSAAVETVGAHLPTVPERPPV